MTSGISSTLRSLDRPEPVVKPLQNRSTGNPLLDQLDTNDDGVINGFEHDIFLESSEAARPRVAVAPPPGLVAELFPAADPF